MKSSVNPLAPETIQCSIRDDDMNIHCGFFMSLKDAERLIDQLTVAIYECQQVLEAQTNEAESYMDEQS